MQKLVRRLNNEKFIILLTLFFSFVALWFSFTNNYILTYNDAASHLNIARRIVDNLTPGAAQIGTVWLPLPHLLMLPFAWIDVLWHTGLAGSIVSMGAYIISIIFMYKLILLVTENKWAGLIGAMIMALNPNLLYLQTTPMTEPLLLATVMLSIYFLARFIDSNNVKDLVLTGVFISLACLTRYDGWFMFVSLIILLPVWVYKTRGREYAESSLFLFIFSGGFGIFLWLLWNQMIFGHALYFLTGPYSAATQQNILKRVGQLPTQGNWFNAVYYYIWSMIDNNGIILTITSAIGLFVVPFLIKQKRLLLIPIVTLLLIVFNILALYSGQSAMNVLQAPHNPGIFNIRYGLMALPAIAFILGIVAVNKYLRILVVVVIAVQSFLFFQQGLPISLADGLHGLQQTYYTVEASSWLKNNYQSGLILTSLASNDAFVARAGLPMRLYVHEGTREHWTNSLSTPSKNVEYIATLTFPPDSVYRALKKNSDFLKNFVLVHQYKTFNIYKKR